MDEAKRDKAVIDLHVQAHVHITRAAKLADAFKKMREDLRDEA